MSKLIHYTVEHTEEALPSHLFEDANFMKDFRALDALRTELVEKDFLGINLQGIGFGNISLRLPSHDSLPAGAFIISGAATGRHKVLGFDGYALVKETYRTSNRVVSQGLVLPSSEALSHAAVYAACPKVRVVVHGHNPRVYALGLAWGEDYTEDALKYGTTDLAKAISKLTVGKEQGFFIMHGHESGFFLYEPSIKGMAQACQSYKRHSAFIEGF